MTTYSLESKVVHYIGNRMPFETIVMAELVLSEMNGYGSGPCEGRGCDSSLVFFFLWFVCLCRVTQDQADCHAHYFPMTGTASCCYYLLSYAA
jgi:hypothetical protein